MKSTILVLLIFLAFSYSASSQNSSTPQNDYYLGFRLAPKISTLGGGIEIAKAFTPNFGVRGGLNYFSFNYDTNEDDAKYDLDLELKSIGFFGDWHPFKGSFRLSGGILINGNQFKSKAKPTAPFQINGTSYNLDAVDLEISYNAVAPYFGIGWDTTFGNHDNWGFCFDLGVIYSGAATASLSVLGDPTVITSPSFLANLESEKASLQDDLNDLEWWPVLSAGLVYQF